MTLRRSLSLLTLLPLVLVACADNGSSAGSSSAGGSTDPADLEGPVWALVPSSIAALSADAPSSATVTVEFSDGQAHGTSGCNSYGGGYQAGDDGSLSFDELAGTMMACDAPLMALESAYLQALGGVTAFSIDGDLVLTGDGTILTYARGASPEPLALIGTTWSLKSIASGDAVSSVIAGTTGSLRLAPDGTASGSAGCNSFHGSYTSGGDRLSFGPLATTRMMCPDDVMAQETAVLHGLERTASCAIDADQLSLLDADGALLLGYAAA